VACDNTSIGQATATFRDSAGVAIVENGPPDRVPTVAVADSDLILEIGGATDDVTRQLFRVEGAQVLSDGRMVVANGGSNELRYFDPDGSFLGAVGREGDGPGEFRYIGWATTCGSDSVWAFDIVHHRAEVFDLEGRYVRSFAFQWPDDQPPYGPAACWNGVFSVLAFPTLGRRPPPGAFRPFQAVFTADRDGRPLGVQDTVPGSDRWGHERGSNHAHFGKRSVHTIGPGGVYVGTGDAPEIRVYAPRNGVRRFIRWQAAQRSVTPQYIDRLREREFANARNPNHRRFLERWFAETVFPAAFPPYDRLTVDALGNLWVREYLAPGDSSDTWVTFDSEGRLVGRVTLPPGFWLFEAGADYLIGRWKDPLDLEYVRVYRYGQQVVMG
jgi:hypothetical protein